MLQEQTIDKLGNTSKDYMQHLAWGMDLSHARPVSLPWFPKFRPCSDLGHSPDSQEDREFL